MTTIQYKWNISSWIILLFIVLLFSCNSNEERDRDNPAIDREENGGLFLPDNFVATAVVNQLKGEARHITVSEDGNIYVKLRKPHEGGGNAVLRDIDGDNVA